MSKKTKVYLNVYDLSNNEIYYPLGLGFYHSGLEVFSSEYTFSQSGCFQQPEIRVAEPAVYRETILLGETSLNYKEVESAFDKVSSDFPGNSYHVMKKNCNNFAEAFAKELLKNTKWEFPGWVNRMATYGNYFSCLLPKEMNDSQEEKKEWNVFQGPGRSLSSSTISKTEKMESELEMRERLLEATLKRQSSNSCIKQQE